MLFQNTYFFGNRNKLGGNEILSSPGEYTFIFKEKLLEESSEPNFSLYVKYKGESYLHIDSEGEVKYELRSIKKFINELLVTTKYSTPDIHIKPLLKSYRKTYSKLVEDTIKKALSQSLSISAIIKDIDVNKLSQLSDEQKTTLFVEFAINDNVACLEKLVSHSVFSKKQNLDHPLSEQKIQEIEKIINVAFERSCIKENFNTVKYLIENQELIYNPSKEKIENTVQIALALEKKNVVGYLLENYSQNLNEEIKKEISYYLSTGRLQHLPMIAV